VFLADSPPAFRQDPCIQFARELAPGYIPQSPFNQALALLFVANRHIRSTEPTLFENPETAKYVLQLFLSINSEMEDSIGAIENQTSPEQLKAFKHDVSQPLRLLAVQVVDLPFGS
jgi:hypothetical protein